MTNFLNLQQIEELEKIQQKKRYYRAFDFARMIALTRFIEELEKNEESFKIVSCSPCIAHLRSKNEKEHENVHLTAKFVIGLWVTIEINEIQYYFQIDENPFFDAYCIVKKFNYEKKTKVSSGIMKINERLYKNTNWDNSEENINTFVKNLNEIFSSVRKNIPTKPDKFLSYRDKNIQEIYTH